VAEFGKENGDLGNRVDALTQENAALKQENEQLKRKAHTKKPKKANIVEAPQWTVNDWNWWDGEAVAITSARILCGN
jgi:regulator of replication initiation timing